MINDLMRRWLGQGAEVKESYSWFEKVMGLVDITRPRLSFMTPLNAGSAAVLALGGYPSFLKCILGFLAVFLGVSGIHCFNDYLDRLRDRKIWPGRPIPSGRVKSYQALGLAIACFAAALVLSYTSFTLLCTLIYLVAISLGCLYSAYLRDKIGYLALPPINGLIYLGGWAAFSPDTLFTNWLPWFLYILAFCWQSAHILVYSPVHPIQKFASRLTTEVRTFFFRTTPQKTVMLGVIFLAVTIMLSILLIFTAGLSPLYLVLVMAMGFLAMESSLAFLKEPFTREKGIKAFSRISNLRLVISAAVLIDVFLFF